MAEQRERSVSVYSIGRDQQTGELTAWAQWSDLPDFTFKLEFTTDGRLVRFAAHAMVGSVSTTVMRRASLGELQRAVWSELAGMVEDNRTSTRKRPRPAWVVEDMEALASDFVDRERPGAAGRRDAHYAALAKMYVELFEAGEPRPVRTLAKQLNLGEKTVRNYLFKARERDLLTSPGQGKAGGVLTDKGEEAFRGHHQAS